MRYGTTLATLITVLAIAFLVKLGFWQLDRASEKQALFDDFNNAQSQVDQSAFQPLPEDPAASSRYTPVTATGAFSDNYLLLDNKIFNGKVGYQVIGLLKVSDRQALIPVNMGWVPVGQDRRQLPNLPLPDGQVQVNGWLYPANADAFTFAEQIVEPSSKAPWRVQQLDFNAISEALELPLANYVVLLSEQSNFGWPRQWSPQVMTPAKHQAYAMQWFSLAIACLIVFFFARRSIIRTKKECE
ncbi:SURF1 family protein [Pseudidiomarina sp. 1APP75-27a]|uniref:SURF1 family protein n=1 Tax=Pseudidiomarina terrestris TaxID=2820060 RepID=UPI00264F324E|nr:MULTISPECIES: SURF1 family protein [unclassified Pseudidiomarina]MDN7126185.1 SURF1 family protein [Pseudidiomarina sp. 1APR75-33.1]MDN7137102.1 SURF1 family protein [Pseudidiomarina sp. 1ASP75-14]MEA3588362.1 SURF1 family protein [Pseudidiomarina sp. 1APP75-27a]